MEVASDLNHEDVIRYHPQSSERVLGRTDGFNAKRVVGSRQFISELVGETRFHLGTCAYWPQFQLPSRMNGTQKQAGERMFGVFDEGFVPRTRRPVGRFAANGSARDFKISDEQRKLGLSKRLGFAFVLVGHPTLIEPFHEQRCARVRNDAIQFDA